MKPPAFPGADEQQYDPTVEAKLAAAHEGGHKQAHPVWYFLGEVTGIVLGAAVALGILTLALTGALVVVGGIDLEPRELLGLALTTVIVALAVAVVTSRST